MPRDATCQHQQRTKLCGVTNSVSTIGSNLAPFVFGLTNSIEIDLGGTSGHHCTRLPHRNSQNIRTKSVKSNITIGFGKGDPCSWKILHGTMNSNRNGKAQ